MGVVVPPPKFAVTNIGEDCSRLLGLCEILLLLSVLRTDGDGTVARMEPWNDRRVGGRKVAPSRL